MNSEKGNLLIVSVFTHYHALLGSLPASLNQSKEAWCALMNLGQLLASLVRQNTFCIILDMNIFLAPPRDKLAAPALQKTGIELNSWRVK